MELFSSWEFWTISFIRLALMGTIFFIYLSLFFFKYADSIGAKVFMGFFRIWSPTHAMNRISPFKNSYILLIHRNSSRQATSILTLFMLLLLVGRPCVAMAIKKKKNHAVVKIIFIIKSSSHYLSPLENSLVLWLEVREGICLGTHMTVVMGDGRCYTYHRL